MIDERRRPPSSVSLLTVTDIDIGGTCITKVLAIECAVLIQFLSIDNADGVALLSAHSHLQPSCDILPHIYDDALSAFCKAWFRHAFVSSQRCRLHPRSHLGTEICLRNIRPLHIHPFRIVEANLAPAFHLHAGIVFLTIVFVISTNRPVGCHLPSFVIGLQSLCATVSIFHDDINATLRIPERMNLVGFVLLHGKVATIA